MIPGSTSEPLDGRPPTEHDSPRARTQHGAQAAFLVVLTLGVALAALRVEPRVWGDPGVWLSVADRLVEGDRLYVDVFDNKDPLFFYTYAASLWAGGVRGPFALEVAWLAAAAAGMVLALRALGAQPLAVLVGAFVYPLALTSAWYVPGATVVPALALAPFALWLWTRRRFAAAGALVVVATLVKLNLGLVIAAPLVAVWVLGATGSRRHAALRGLAGATAAVLAAAVVLGVRGELKPYLETIAYNVYYSGAGVGDGGIRAHLEVARVLFAGSGRWQLPAAELFAVALIAVSLVGWWRRFGRAYTLVSAAALATLAASAVTVALTAVFTVHLQLLAYGIALGAATFVSALESLGRPLAVVAAAGTLVFAGWSSLKHEDLSKLSLATWTVEPVSTPGRTLARTRAQLFGPSAPVTYAVFGRNTEDGHAAFVDESMDLTCRFFHQYPFYRAEQLDETIDCVRREEPMLVLVTTSFYDPIAAAPRWEAFVARARALLRDRYALVTEQGMSQVWSRT